MLTSETQSMMLGDLLVVATRQPDGTVRLRVDPGKEQVHLVMYPNKPGGYLPCRA